MAWTIESGPTQATTSATTVVATTSTGITTGSTIAGVGRYDLAGGAVIKLSGGTDGTFMISSN